MGAAAAYFARLGGFAAARSALFERKRAQWKFRGNRYLRSHGGMPANALVQVDPDHELQILGLMEAAAPRLASGYNRHLIPLAERAFDRWPVDSGLSKSLIGTDFAVLGDGSRFRGRVDNRAPYAWFIRWTGRLPYGTVVRDLIFRPGDAAADAIARDALEDLD